MKFRYTIFYGEDVAASIDFFCRAFGFRASFIHPEGDFAQLETGETLLAFCSRRLLQAQGKSPGQPSLEHPVFEIALETDDVPAALDKALRAGGRLIEETRLQDWGQQTAYVADPNGFLVEICSPMTAG
ncbi:MAG: VOC family protein [Lautropia sp.]|nr:VOC family protein [Lautropia sp.]